MALGCGHGNRAGPPCRGAARRAVRVERARRGGGRAACDRGSGSRRCASSPTSSASTTTRCAPRSPSSRPTGVLERRHGSGTFVAADAAAHERHAPLVQQVVRWAADAGVGQRELAAALYVDAGRGAPAPADAAAEERRALRDDIAVLERVLAGIEARLPVSQVPPGESAARHAGARVLSADDLREQRDAVVRRIALAQRALDGETERRRSPQPSRRPRRRASRGARPSPARSRPSARVDARVAARRRRRRARALRALRRGLYLAGRKSEARALAELHPRLHRALPQAARRPAHPAPAQGRPRPAARLPGDADRPRARLHPGRRPARRRDHRRARPAVGAARRRARSSCASTGRGRGSRWRSCCGRRSGGAGEAATPPTRP